MFKVYLASALGFSPELKAYREQIRRRLYEIGSTVLDPWEQPFHEPIQEAHTIQDWTARLAAFKAIAGQIGKANEDMIRSCDIVLGVLDGPELDSGTVSEIGFGAGLYHLLICLADLPCYFLESRNTCSPVLYGVRFRNSRMKFLIPRVEYGAVQLMKPLLDSVSVGLPFGRKAERRCEIDFEHLDSCVLDDFGKGYNKGQRKAFFISDHLDEYGVAVLAEKGRVRRF